MRPFTSYADNGPGRPMTVIQGAIDGTKFFLTVFGAQVDLPIAAVGSDAQGPFAEVMEVELPLQDGFRVRVEPDASDYGVDGTHILVFKSAPVPEGFRGAVPVERGISVYFGPGGEVDGGGSAGTTHRSPPEEPS